MVCRALLFKFMIELCYVLSYKINDFARWACEQRRCGLYNFNGNCKLSNFRQSLLRFSQIVPLCYLNNNTSSKRPCGFYNFNGNCKNYRFHVFFAILSLLFSLRYDDMIWIFRCRYPKALFSISFEAIVSPKRNSKQWLCKMLEGQHLGPVYMEVGNLR